MNFQATSEVMPAAEEQLYFTHLEESRATVPQYINHTPGAESSKAIRLNNYRTRKERSIGAAISLKVRAGDTLRSEVFVKYLKIQPDPSPDIQALLLALPVSMAVSPGAIDQLAARSATGAESLLPIPLNGEKSSETTPRAYLNYILYDTKMQVVDAGYVRVSEAAEIPDTHPHSHEHERLAREVVATQPGYAYFYVSSESREDVEVFFPARRSRAFATQAGTILV